jgi:hypothetical protein
MRRKQPETLAAISSVTSWPQNLDLGIRVSLGRRFAQRRADFRSFASEPDTLRGLCRAVMVTVQSRVFRYWRDTLSYPSLKTVATGGMVRLVLYQRQVSAKASGPREEPPDLSIVVTCQSALLW